MRKMPGLIEEGGYAATFPPHNQTFWDKESQRWPNTAAELNGCGARAN